MHTSPMPATDIAALTAAYMDGTAVTAGLVASYARDGVDITPGRHTLTDDEFRAVADHARTLPSTPANNVWD